MRYPSELTSIVRAVNIISDEAFAFAGKSIRISHRSNGQTSPVPEVPLVQALMDLLYQRCYTRRFDGRYENVAENQSGDDVAFQSSLSLANQSTEGWDRGWVVEQLLSAGQYLVHKNGKYKFVYPGQFVLEEHNASLPNVGSRISIRRLKDSAFQPGFYYVFSDTQTSDENLVTLVRFYWNVKSSGATKLVEGLTRRLNKYHIPFSFKCLNTPQYYTRSDAAVLYVSKPLYHVTTYVLREMYPTIQNELNPWVPLFTKELAPGLGLAEDPADGDSFGMSRCRLLARAIYLAYRSGDSSEENVLRSIETAFKSAGLRLETPYLNEASQDSYSF